MAGISYSGTSEKIKEVRHPYVRFFLSSTFVDMEIERNIVNKIFNRIAGEYFESGWHVELVDLRWGINREASDSNRTIDICMEELRICKEMSPRPNFIALIGERYGWIPLISSLTSSDMEVLLDNATDEEKIVIKRCYRQDKNNTFGLLESFFLRELSDINASDLVCLNRVYHNMGCLSATATEIEAGIFWEEDRRERVVAFRRTFSSHDGLDSNLFFDENTDLQRQLADEVKRLVPKENLIEVELTPEQYYSRKYEEWFESEMEKAIRKLINREIEYTKAHPYSENDLHIEFAEKKCEKFVGISTGIEELRRYIESTDENLTPIWISGYPEGTGITTLLSKLVCEYAVREDYDVIARFCGETLLSSTPETLMDSIFLDISSRSLKKRKLNDRQSLKKDYMANRLEYPYSFWLGENITHLPKNKRYLLVIDGLDMFHDNEFSEPSFFDLRWLCYRSLPTNVRIIVNTGHNANFYLSPNYDMNSIERIPIGTPVWMGIESDISIKGKEYGFIQDYLMLLHRKLTASQIKVLKQWYRVDHSTREMLAVLAEEFALLHSYDKPNEFPPKSSPNIVDYFYNGITKRLRQPQYHGEDLFDSAIELLSFSPIGIPDSVMRDLLWNVPAVRKYAEGNSLHAGHFNSLPPIFWSRLRYDLSNWLTYTHSAVGLGTRLQHHYILSYQKEFLWENQPRWVDGVLENPHQITIDPTQFSLDILRVMLDYALNNWQKQPWSLYMLPLLLYKSSSCYTEIGENALALLDSFLNNPEYISRRFSLDGTAICENITKALKLCNSQARGYEKVDCAALVNLRTEIMLIDRKLTQEQFCIYASQQPVDSQLYKIFKNYRGNALKNSLKDFSNANSIITHIGQGLTIVALDNKGEKALLTNVTKTEVYVRYIYKGYDECIFSVHEKNGTDSKAPAQLFSTDSNLECCAILHEDNIITVHHIGKNLLTGRPDAPVSIKSEEKVNWIRLSPDQTWFFAGDSKQVRIWKTGTFIHNRTLDLSRPWEVVLSFAINNVYETACFSHTTNYVWLQTGKHILRYHLPDFSIWRIDTSVLPEPQYVPDGSDKIYRLAFANDDTFVTVCGNTAAVIRIPQEGGWKGNLIYTEINWVLINVLISANNPDELYLFFANGKWIKYDISNLDGSNLPFEVGSNFSVEITSANLESVASKEKNFVFNFREARKIDYTSPVFIQSIIGINYIASDYAGNLLSITKGCNDRLQSFSYFNVLNDNNGKWRMLNLPGGPFFAFTSAISPDGKRLAAYTSGLDVYDGKSLQLIQNTDLRYLACNVMTFSSDSKWLIVADGDYLTTGKQNFWICDADGNIIRKFSIDQIGDCTGNPTYITPDNRYLLTNDNGIYDLIEECMFEENSEYDFSSAHHYFTEPYIRFSCWLGAMSPDGHYAYSKFKCQPEPDKLCRLDLQTRKFKSLKTEMDALAITPDGKSLYVIDKEKRLFSFNLSDESITAIPIDFPICKIYPSFDGKYMFAVTFDGFVLFCDTNGNVLEKAILRGSVFTLCNKGLTVGQANGSFYLLQPSAHWNMNKKVFAPAVRRYNLESKTLDKRKTVVCPVCGSIHPAQKGVMKCNNCNVEIEVI